MKTNIFHSVLLIAGILTLASCFLIPPVDEELPTCIVESPIEGAEVSGTIDVKVTASDNVEIHKVTLRVDSDNSILTDDSAPWEFSWNSSTVSIGDHKLSVTVHDTTGNIKVTTVNVKVVPGATATLQIEDFQGYEPFNLDASHVDRWLKAGWDFYLKATAKASIAQEAGGNRYLLIDDTYNSDDFALFTASLPALAKGTFSFKVWPEEGNKTNLFWGLRTRSTQLTGTDLITSATSRVKGTMMTKPDGGVVQFRSGGSNPLSAGSWHELKVEFDLAINRCNIVIDGTRYDYSQAFEGSTTDTINDFYIRTFSLKPADAAIYPHLSYTKCRIDDVTFDPNLDPAVFSDITPIQATPLPAPAANRLWGSDFLLDEIELQWDSVIGAAHYALYRVDANGLTQIALFPHDGRSYYVCGLPKTDTSLIPDPSKEYQFKVAALSASMQVGVLSEVIKGRIARRPPDMRVSTAVVIAKTLSQDTVEYPSYPYEISGPESTDPLKGKHQVHTTFPPATTSSYRFKVWLQDLEALWSIIENNNLLRNITGADPESNYIVSLTVNSTTYTYPIKPLDTTDAANVKALTDFIDARIPLRIKPMLTVPVSISRSSGGVFANVDVGGWWDAVLDGARAWHLERDSVPTFNSALRDTGSFLEAEGATGAVSFSYQAGELGTPWLTVPIHYTRVQWSAGGIFSPKSDTKSSSVTN